MVTGIGQCSLDYLALIDSYPEVDTKKEIFEWEEQGGGPVATALVTLSRLGVKGAFHGIIGDDEAGVLIKQSLVDEHVDTRGLIKRANATSQVAFIPVEKNSGKRTIFWKRPTGEELRCDELEDDFLSGCNFLLLDGLMKEVSLYAAKKAKRLKMPVMLDAGRLREGILDIAKVCDYVVASEEFAKEIGWKDSAEEFREILGKLKLKTVTITLGVRGSLTFVKNKFFHVPAFEVDVVDTTGAGDVFHGGYIYGLLQKWSLTDTVRFASAVAALKCRQMGGRAGIPALDEVAEFLKGR